MSGVIAYRSFNPVNAYEAIIASAIASFLFPLLRQSGLYALK